MERSSSSRSLSRMEGSSSSRRMVRINRASSIESEPRTLNFDQIHYAREAAIYVLNTRSIEEASSIFTQGLEPVVSALKEDERMTMMDSDERGGGEEEEQHLLNGIPLTMLPQYSRDIATAPF